MSTRPEDPTTNHETDRLEQLVLELLSSKPIELLAHDQSIYSTYSKDNPDSSVVLHAIGITCYQHYAATGRTSCLRDAVELVGKALEWFSADGPDRLQILEQFSAICVLYCKTNEGEDALRRIRNHRDSFPSDLWADPNHCGVTYNLANIAWLSFERSSKCKDLRDSVDLYNLCLIGLSDGDSRTAWAHHNLAEAYLECYRRTFSICALNDSIHHHTLALQLRIHDHPDRLTSLRSLSLALATGLRLSTRSVYIQTAVKCTREALMYKNQSFLERLADALALSHFLVLAFEQSGRKPAIDEAIDVCREALETLSHTHPQYLAILCDLQHAVLLRAQHFGGVFDLQEAVKLGKELRDLKYPDAASGINAHANSLMTCYDYSRRLEDLEGAVEGYSASLVLRPKGHILHAVSLLNLAKAVSARWRHMRATDVPDLTNSIAMFEEALQLCPPGHMHRLRCLSLYASLLQMRYVTVTRDVENLNYSVLLLKEVIKLRPRGHLDYYVARCRLGLVLLARSDTPQYQSDLDEGILLLSETLSLPASSSIDQWRVEMQLAHAYVKKFRIAAVKNNANLDDLNEGISLYVTAITSAGLSPTIPEDVVELKQNHATALCLRYVYLGHIEDLEIGIGAYHAITNEGSHDQRFLTRRMLAVALGDRFMRLGRARDLKRSIKLLRWVSKNQRDHLDRANTLANLAGTLHLRYTHSGRISDQEDSIRRYRMALDIIPEGHNDRGWAESNLASALFTRYREYGKDSNRDLNEAIELGEAAIKSYPADRPGRAQALRNLSEFLLHRYAKSQSQGDYDAGVNLVDQSLDALFEGDPERAIALTYSSFAHRVRFGFTGDTQDKKREIELCIEALGMLPPGHPQRPSILHDLGSTLCSVSQFEEGMRYLSESISSLPRGHPDRPAHLNTQATWQLEIFKRSGEENYLTGAVKACCEAIYDDSLGAKLRVDAAVGFLTEAEVFLSSMAHQEHTTLVNIYKKLIALFPQVAYLGLDINSRLRSLRHCERMAAFGAQHALGLNEIATAVELLENGRGVFWRQALRLKAVKDELSADSTSRKLQTISRQLEIKSFDRIPLDSSELFLSSRHWEEESSRRRRLSEQFETLLRKLGQTSSSLMNRLYFEELNNVAEEGPVVILLAGSKSCQAVAFRAGKGAVVIGLPNVSYRSLQLLKKSMTIAIAHTPASDLPNTTGSTDTYRAGGSKAMDMDRVLVKLWTNVVKVVYDALDLKVRNIMALYVSMGLRTDLLHVPIACAWP
ncbi:hypothetical protein K474DRAFT_685512 [Panus rudis PR-1116 ss-1]|nr:hypothetical protein K474DRAFT_685512 [Panus rudis PR-1116 ss-1]